MNDSRFVLFILLAVLAFKSQAQQKPVVYLIPGQGSDHRVFKNFVLDSTFEIRHIEYVTPEEGMNMSNYALLLSQQIDTNEPFVLVGVSLGGMLATEMNDFLEPEQTIVISTAKTREELPWQYKFQRKLPIYRMFTGKALQKGAQIMQPLVEPDRKQEKETCKAMLSDKDPDFMKRTITMILEWDRPDYNPEIIHIHGNKDNTIPIRNVHYDYLLENGSHMMALTQGEVISRLINEILTK